jgi:hypothetical protein
MMEGGEGLGRRTSGRRGERRDSSGDGVDRGNEEREDWRRHRSESMREERRGEKRRAAG